MDMWARLIIELEPSLPPERKIVLNMNTFYFMTMMPPLLHPQTLDKWQNRKEEKDSYLKRDKHEYTEGSVTLMDRQMLMSAYQSLDILFIVKESLWRL